jgi:hypothetical protein
MHYLSLDINKIINKVTYSVLVNPHHDLPNILHALQQPHETFNHISAIKFGVDFPILYAEDVWLVVLTLPNLNTLHIECLNRVDKLCLDTITKHCKQLKSFILCDNNADTILWHKPSDLIHFVREMPQLEYVEFLCSDTKNILKQARRLGPVLTLKEQVINEWRKIGSVEWLLLFMLILLGLWQKLM